MQEITLNHGRLQTKLCDDCWHKIYDLKTSTVTMDNVQCNPCKKMIWNESLNEWDKLYMDTECSSKSKVMDICKDCQEKMLTQAKMIQFPFKKIGRLTLKYNKDNKLENISLVDCK